MIPYKSKSGKPSGVTAYDIGDDFIEVKFTTDTYKYTVALNGKSIISKMKLLAEASAGLSTFISRHRSTLKFEPLD